MPIVDEAIYGVIGHDSTAAYRIPMVAIPHFIAYDPEQLVLDNLSHMPKNRRLLCDPKRAHRYFAIWNRTKFEEYRNHKPYNVCARCWKLYHKLTGQDAPEQLRRNPTADYDVMPLREVVIIGSGERWTPAKIIHRHNSYERRDEAMDKHGLRADGGLKRFHHGHALGVVRRNNDLLEGSYAYYDADREYAASEVRSEIVMLRRKLTEAQQHLLEVYVDEQTDDPRDSGTT